MAVVAHLTDLKAAIENGDVLPTTATAAIDLASVIIRRYVEHMNRLKAAIGPTLCEVARFEAQAAEDTDPLGLAPPRGGHEPPQASLAT